MTAPRRPGTYEVLDVLDAEGEVPSWRLVLFTAGLFETAFAVLLKLSDGLSRPWPTAGVMKLVSIGLVLAGVVGLNLSGVTP